MPEELTLDQSFGESRAVDGNERPSAFRAQSMDGPRDQFLAGARFPQQEHGRLCRRDTVDQVEHVIEGLGFPDQASGTMLFRSEPRRPQDLQECADLSSLPIQRIDRDPFLANSAAPLVCMQHRRPPAGPGGSTQWAADPLLGARLSEPVGDFEAQPAADLRSTVVTLAVGIVGRQDLVAIGKQHRGVVQRFQE